MISYLDNSATTRVCPQAAAAATVAMNEEYFNPSAIYAAALPVMRRVDGVRRGLLGAMGARTGRIVFTSGGTEGDYLSIEGAMRKRGAEQMITTRVEHPAVLRNAERFRCQYLTTLPDGGVDVDEFERMVKGASGLGLVSVMHVNNETGAVFPVEQLAAITRRESGALFHCDGVQGFLSVSQPCMDDIDFYSISGHKLHALKGIGALYISERAKPAQASFGGGQEGGLRSGTENTPGIYSLGEAVKYKQANDDPERVMGLKLRLYNGIMDVYPGALVNGPAPENAAPHILNVSFPGILAEVLLHALEGEGIYVSKGSACSARQSHPSHVLAAMGLSAARISSAIRFSLSCQTTADEIDYTISMLKKHLPILARFKRR